VYAAFLLLWLQAVGFGGSKADTLRIERDQAPEQMWAEIDRVH
jgi:hypothetical protein